MENKVRGVRLIWRHTGLGIFNSSESLIDEGRSNRFEQFKSLLCDKTIAPFMDGKLMNALGADTIHDFEQILAISPVFFFFNYEFYYDEIYPETRRGMLLDYLGIKILHNIFPEDHVFQGFEQLCIEQSRYLRECRDFDKEYGDNIRAHNESIKKGTALLSC